MQFPHLGQRPVARFTGHYQIRAKNNPSSSTETEEKESKDGVLFLYGAPIRAIPKAKSTESSEPPYERMKYPSLPKPISSFISAEAEPEQPISNKKTSPDTTEIRSKGNQEDGWLDFFGAHIHPVQKKTPDTTTTSARAWVPYPSLHLAQTSTETREPEVASKQKSSRRNPTASRESNEQNLRQDTWPFYGAQIPAIVTIPEEPDTPPRFQYPSLRQFLDS